MKGISHFVAGVAAASCVPEAVRAAAEDGNPTYFILGGVFGLLPDTIDFKFSRYFYRHDIEVTPDPIAPDAQAIADKVAEAINRAHVSGESVRVKLNTIPVGLDQWQQYEVSFDVAARTVAVRYGPVVDTGQNLIPGRPPPPNAEAVAPVNCEVKIEYLSMTQIDIFDGPVFSMDPTDDGRVSPGFIPWHRAWSHSLVIGVLFGLIGGVVWDLWATAVIFGASAMHAIFDQLGYMGSALFYPFQSRRMSGMKLMHSGQALANLTAVWGCCLLVFWNLWRATPGGIPTGGTRALIGYGLVLPGLVIALYRRIRTKRAA
ncbi:MAG: metal-dependent hydrolase [Verrucomicrobia bacterium]|jgi:hypothetical protein|nr:metal-dependent hydrolase [Verrucomicrobiota bacterium]MBT7067206.1 metal-dependent hydrolase [Verrucomicrobiota bacterium]MBT7700494.1 metal-dependent hydrolase [Verrucomicrobiota bacterium]